MTTHFKLAEHAQLIFFARSPEKYMKYTWGIHENVSFRSVHDGQLQLCMSLLCVNDLTFRSKNLLPDDCLYGMKLGVATKTF
jgi:hypothetical protein